MATEEMPARRFIRRWIENHYGPVTVEGADSDFLATVPVANGTASGRGRTETEALKALWADLTSKTVCKGGKEVGY